MASRPIPSLKRKRWVSLQRLGNGGVDINEFDHYTTEKRALLVTISGINHASAHLLVPAGLPSSSHRGIHDIICYQKECL